MKWGFGKQPLAALSAGIFALARFFSATDTKTDLDTFPEFLIQDRRLGEYDPMPIAFSVVLSAAY